MKQYRTFPLKLNLPDDSDLCYLGLSEWGMTDQPNGVCHTVCCTEVNDDLVRATICYRLTGYWSVPLGRIGTTEMLVGRLLQTSKVGPNTGTDATVYSSLCTERTCRVSVWAAWWARNKQAPESHAQFLHQTYLTRGKTRPICQIFQMRVNINIRVVFTIESYAHHICHLRLFV